MKTFISRPFESIWPIAEYDASDRQNDATTLTIGHEMISKGKCRARQNRPAGDLIDIFRKFATCARAGASSRNRASDLNRARRGKPDTGRLCDCESQS